ncbi:MAG TPA: RnfABCDGE type electron transport complex subunit D [Candidatus Binataceae bacterium]
MHAAIWSFHRKRFGFLANLQGASDPRIFQITFLGLLLAAGVFLRDFSLHPAQVFFTLAAALSTQRLSWIANPPISRSYRSAIITSLSLVLLLRADNLIVHPLAAAAAISSKSLFRIRGKHLFNPATLGIVFAITCLPGTWVSPGQWGHDVAIAGWLVVLGTTVAHRAHRNDLSFAFLALYLGAIALRVIYLGQLWPVWTHQLTNGAILLFAFFMISDPMTSPNSRRGRIAHAATVAAIAFGWQFHFFSTNGLIWALFFAAPAVPLWDAIWPAPKFAWCASNGGEHEIKIGVHSNDRDARALRRGKSLRAA